MNKEDFLSQILQGINELPSGKYVAFDDNYLNGRENGKSIETTKMTDLFLEFTKWKKEDPNIVIYFDVLENDKLTVDEAFSLNLIHPNKLDAIDHPNKLDAIDFKVVNSKQELDDLLQENLDENTLDLLTFNKKNGNNFPEA